MALPSGIKTMAELMYKATFDYADTEIIKIRKFSVSPVVSSDQTVDMWPYESNRVNLSAAETLSFTSTSANDTLGGSGTQAVYINGLDNDFNPIAEVVLMNGLTPVVTAKSFIRVNSLVALDFTDPEAPNQGRILGTASTAGTVQCIIETNQGVDQSDYFTVPAGYTAFPVSRSANVYRASGNGRRAGEFESEIIVPEQVYTEVLLFSLSTDGTAYAKVTYDMPAGIPEKSDLIVHFTAETNATKASGTAEYILIRGSWTKPENTIYEL